MTGVGRAALITASAAAATMLVDRGLKRAVEHRLSEGEQLRGPLDVRIVRRTNHAGIAHVTPGSSAHAGLLGTGAVLATGIAGAGVLLGRSSTMLPIGAGLLAGGMASNLLDRASGGGVTDFLPSPLGLLNAADVAIAAGILVGGIGLVLR